MKSVPSILIILLSLVLFANAQNQTLTKPLTEKVMSLSPKLESINHKYPALVKETETMDFSDQGKQAIELLKKHKAYGDVQKIVISNGFKSVEEYVALMSRIVSALSAVQKEQMPEGYDMDQIMMQQKMQMEQMKSQGLPPELIAQMEESLKQSTSSFEMMEKAAASAKPADISFVKANLDWLMKLMESTSVNAE